MELDLSADQRAALSAIYAPFRETGEWPEYRYVDKALDRLNLVSDEVLASLPPGLMVPDPARPSFFPQSHEAVALTIAGIGACEGSERDLDLFMRVLCFFVALEETHSPPPTGGEPLCAGSAELESQLGLSRAESRRAYALLKHEIGILGGGSSNADEWSSELPPRIRRFRGVKTIADYLDKRVVPPPHPGLPAGWGERFAEGVGIVVSEMEIGLANAGLIDERRWAGALARIAEHQIVATVIAGVIASVIAGVILAAIYGAP